MWFSLKMKMLVVVWILLHVSQHGSGEVVEVYKGEESVLLPCHMLFNSTSSDATVAWNHGRDKRLVHVRDKDGDSLDNQNKHYCGRTSMRDDALQTEDLSLTLRNPTSSDSGTYTCTVRIKGMDKGTREVQLSVTEPPPPPPVWPIVLAVVLVPLLVLAAVAGFIWYLWSKDRAVQQVEVDPWVESVQLPCRTTVLSVCSLDYLVRLCRKALLLPEDVTVEWTDNKDKKVHVYQNKPDKPGEQDQIYRGRTEMKRDLLKPGDLSLTLKKPTDSDSYIYTCTVYKSEGNNLMKKIAISQVKVPRLEVDSWMESVQLPCKTTAHLPETFTVEWWDNNDREVYVYEKSSDQPEEQDQFYRGQTEMKRDLLKPGDIILTLKHPTDGDRETYTCTGYDRERNIRMKKEVELKVKDCEVKVEEGEESVQLPFRTTGDLPEDTTVVWRHEPMIVHVYHNGSDQPEEQHHFYRDQTEMKKDLLKTGDVSLTLIHPTDRDTGEYDCEMFHNGVLMRQKKVLFTVREEPKNSTAPPPVMVDPPPVMSEFELMDESTPLKTDQHV